ncbi:MAG: flavodoxin family protein [Bacteroidales bacterium]|nr:flavodoxin family protein [Bacteroidales bacterium]
MKVLIVNGSPNKEGCTYTALKEFESVLIKHNISTHWVYLGKKPVAGCIACGYCTENGHCFQTDVVAELQKRVDEFDAMVVGSPVYYSGPTGQVIAFLDRLFYGGFQQNMAGKPGCAVVSCRRGGASATYEQLNQYFSISNMPIVSSQYWNSVHGFTADDVKKDLEGLQTMRTLAQNMVYLLQLIESGKKHGINKPQYEDWIGTHFIMDK